MPEDLIYRFGEFKLDTRRHLLEFNSEPVRLEEKQYLILLVLLDDPGRLVKRDTLVSKVWNGSAEDSTDVNLNHHISRLRLALNDDPSAPTYIDTIKKLGYRFKAQVQCSDVGASEASTDSGRSSVATRRNSPEPTQGGMVSSQSVGCPPVDAAAVGADTTYQDSRNAKETSNESIFPPASVDYSRNTRPILMSPVLFAATLSVSFQTLVLSREHNPDMNPISWVGFFGGLLGLVCLFANAPSRPYRWALHGIWSSIAVLSWAIFLTRH